MSLPTAFLPPTPISISRVSTLSLSALHPLKTPISKPTLSPLSLPRILPHASTIPTTASANRASILHLQNGSDIRGVSSPLDPSQPVNLTPDTICEIIRAFVEYTAFSLQKPASSLRIALGRDSRISGPELLSAAARGAQAAGVNAVADFGLATTPAMFMATVLEGYEYDCACMLTASHLPPNRNGAKFFTRKGSANKGDIKGILERTAEAFEKGKTVQSVDEAEVENVDFLTVYGAHLVRLIREGCAHPERFETPLEGFRIVVNAGNGAAGFFADVLEELGADVVGMFLEPDGMFPNHVPNPEDKKAMAFTIAEVERVKADLGIIFDTDVDRSGVVDSSGLGINRNRLIALIAKIVLRQTPGSTIVTDSVTSNGLKRFIEKEGGKHFRYRKGYKNVIDKGIELNKAGINTELAMETSGHGAMKENYMLDDGAYLAVKILIEMVRLSLSGDSRGIAGLLDGLDSPVEEYEFRLGFIDKNKFQEYSAQVVAAFADFVTGVEGWSMEETNYEGFRVNVDEGDGKTGWLLLRPSLHDPLLALNIESEREGGIARIAQVLTTQFFPQFANVDIGKLVQRAVTMA